MQSTFLPSTSEIHDEFVQELAAVGGTVSDTYDDGRRLFVRAVLPQVREVRTRDRMQGGVALRASGLQIRVHPYLFRQVCRNGAILAQAIQTCSIERVECEFDPPQADVALVLSQVREAVRSCCDESVFAAAAARVRSSVESEADLILNMSPGFFRLAGQIGGEVIRDILDRFEAEGDRSAFGLMNAVTSLARDTQDPEVRWRLEELGGGVPALLRPRHVPDDAAAVAVRA
jgi:hypothetical protein